MTDIIIRNGRIIDGSNRAEFLGDVLIEGDRIVDIGKFPEATGEVEIDATGKVVAPGFIDVHTHSDAHLLRTPHIESKTRQGFTTELIMLDGLGYAPVNAHTVHHWIHYLRPLNGLRFEEYCGWESISDYMELLRGKTAQNVACHIPYANLRSIACGFGVDTPDDYQMLDIKRMVLQGMEEGAVGLSTGLDYAEQCFARKEELLEACEPLMFFDAPYVTHVRYSLGTLAGVIEAVDIGMEAGVPVHISHLKSRTPEEGENILDYINTVAMDVVDFSFDVYPYGSSSTMLQYMLPHEVWREGPLAAVGRLSERKLRDTFARSLKHQMLDKTYIGWVSSRQNQAYQGWTLANYVEHVGKQPADALADLLIEEGMNVLLVFRGWAPNVVEPFLKHSCFMMGSDGILFEDGVVHPRQYASATRLLSHYTRERGLLTLPEAIHKMSEKPARRFGLLERGLIMKGYFADIVVFDLEKLDERSQFGDPHHFAEGVSEVFVNGSPIILGGEAVPAMDAWPGRVLKFKQA